MAIARRLSVGEAAVLAKPLAELDGWTSAADMLRYAQAGAKLLAVLHALGITPTPRSFGRALGGLAAEPPHGFVVATRIYEGELLYNIAEGTSPPVVLNPGRPISDDQANRWEERLALGLDDQVPF